MRDLHRLTLAVVLQGNNYDEAGICNDELRTAMEDTTNRDD